MDTPPEHRFTSEGRQKLKYPAYFSWPADSFHGDRLLRGNHETSQTLLGSSRVKNQSRDAFVLSPISILSGDCRWADKYVLLKIYRQNSTYIPDLVSNAEALRPAKAFDMPNAAETCKTLLGFSSIAHQLKQTTLFFPAWLAAVLRNHELCAYFAFLAASLSIEKETQSLTSSWTNCAGSSASLPDPSASRKTPVRTRLDTHGGPAAFAPRMSPLGLSEASNVFR